LQSIVEFEFIEIMDNSQSYPTFLGLDWAFNNQWIINLKKREIIFEGGGLMVTASLDLMEARRYVELVRKEIVNLYNITTQNDLIMYTRQRSTYDTESSEPSLAQEEEKHRVQIKCVDMSIWHGQCHLKFRIRWQCSSKTDMGDDGEIEASLVKFSVEVG
jgi:hypothetical protein